MQHLFESLQDDYGNYSWQLGGEKDNKMKQFEKQQRKFTQTQHFRNDQAYQFKKSFFPPMKQHIEADLYCNRLWHIDQKNWDFFPLLNLNLLWTGKEISA